MGRGHEEGVISVSSPGVSVLSPPPSLSGTAALPLHPSPWFWHKSKLWEGFVGFETCPVNLLKFIWNFASSKDGQSVMDGQEEKQTDKAKTKMERQGDMGSGIRGGERNREGLEPGRRARVEPLGEE